MPSNVMQEDEFTGRPELVHKRARALLWQRTAWTLLVIYMVVSLTAVLVTSVAGIQSRAQVLDCTQPSGECYKQGTKRTATVVAGINAGTKEVVVIAAGCARVPGNDTTAEVERCVNQELEKRHVPSPDR